ncbi:hypothetical protein Dimus_037696 [Dionaea muscipula]
MLAMLSREDVLYQMFSDDEGSGTERPRPSSPLSPIPSISSRGDSWIEEAYGDKGEASSSTGVGPQAQPSSPLPRSGINQEVRWGVLEEVAPEQAAAPPAPAPDPNVGQQPLIPELDPPLLTDNIRREELDHRLGLILFGHSYAPSIRDSIVETQLQIEKKIEGALVSDGYSPDDVFAKRHKIRGFLFYPHGTALEEGTYLSHLKEIRRNGTRESVPYRRITRALKNFYLLIATCK